MRWWALVWLAACSAPPPAPPEPTYVSPAPPADPCAGWTLTPQPAQAATTVVPYDWETVGKTLSGVPATAFAEVQKKRRELHEAEATRALARDEVEACRAERPLRELPSCPCAFVLHARFAERRETLMREVDEAEAIFGKALDAAEPAGDPAVLLAIAQRRLSRLEALRGADTPQPQPDHRWMLAPLERAVAATEAASDLGFATRYLMAWALANVVFDRPAARVLWQEIVASGRADTRDVATLLSIDTLALPPPAPPPKPDTRPRCPAQQCRGEGMCDAWFGNQWRWDGASCRELAEAGCNLVGRDCKSLYVSLSACEAARAKCRH
jgi:hypothetical protein